MSESRYDREKRMAPIKAKNPEVGDAWWEMCNFACVVVAVFPGHVVICKDKKDVDKDHWTWNLDKLDVMKVEDFDKWLQYGSIAGEYWAHPCEKPMKWVADVIAAKRTSEVMCIDKPYSVRGCPFCGSRNIGVYLNAPSSDQHEWPHVTCMDCGAGHTSIEKWNKREVGMCL